MKIDEYNKKIEEKYGINKYKVHDSNLDNIFLGDRIFVECCNCGELKETNARTFIRIVAKTDKFKAKLECKKCREIAHANRIKRRPEHTTESIQKELFEKFEILEYKNNSDIDVICKKCNNKFNSTLVTLRKSNGCINCNGRKTYTKEELQKISDERNWDLEIEEIFIKRYNTCMKHFVKILKDGKEYSKSVSEFLRYGIKRESKRNIESLKKEVFEKTNGKYSIQDTEYIGRKSFYTFYNVLTGYKRRMIFDNFMKNPHLEKTMFSKYSIRVFSILNDKNIYFKKEKSYYQIGKRRFDIWIPKTDEIIEIDGEQHFSDARNNLYQTINSDIIKNEYIKKSNKVLLRISYKEFLNNNIEEILDLFFKKDYEKLIKFNVLLIYKRKIFNQDTYYEPVRKIFLKELTENLINCGKSLRASDT